MKAICVSGDRVTLRRDFPRPIRGAGEALIRVLVAGICSSDAHLAHGDLGFYGVPGHEFVGVVEDADRVALTGKRVVGEINCPCGHCQLCRLGLGKHCRSRTALGLWKRDGAFAEYVTLPEVNLHIVPEDMDDDTAVFAEPISTSIGALEQGKPGLNDRALVAGDGWMGLLVAQVFASRCKVAILGFSEARMAVARSLGFQVVKPDAHFDRDFDIAVETTGSGIGLRSCIDSVRPAGKLILTAMILGDTPVPLWKLSGNEINLTGLRGGAFTSSIQVLHEGAVKVKPLITARYGLDEFPQALAKSKELDSIKVLIYPAGVP